MQNATELTETERQIVGLCFFCFKLRMSPFAILWEILELMMRRNIVSPFVKVPGPSSEKVRVASVLRAQLQTWNNWKPGDLGVPYVHMVSLERWNLRF